MNDGYKTKGPTEGTFGNDTLNKYFDMRMKWIVFFLTLLISFPGYAQKKPNILIIIADDLSKNLGVYGEEAIKTPNIDGVAKNGFLFDNAFCTASSCSPSRASILTGKYPHELKEGGNLWGTLPVAFPNYVTILGKNGYLTGLQGKGWGPGNAKIGGYFENPAGRSYENFNTFLKQLQPDQPFCFWIGSSDPHRPYDKRLTDSVNIDTKKIKVPKWLPDNAQVREDIKDYLAEVKRFDNTVGEAVHLLDKKGLLNNTLIIVTSDNGMPFPRAKATVYDSGTNIPLIVSWGNKLKKGTRLKELVSLVDIAPTILDAAGIEANPAMTGQSILPLLQGESAVSPTRFDAVFTERERHANVRPGNGSYPVRAIRTREYLYIENLMPDRWPAGNPKFGYTIFGDIDAGGAKQFLVENRHNPIFKNWIVAALEKRPTRELYFLKTDSMQLHNVAGDKRYEKIVLALHKKLNDWRKKTKDPMFNSSSAIFDTYPYYGRGDDKALR